MAAMLRIVVLPRMLLAHTLVQRIEEPGNVSDTVSCRMVALGPYFPKEFFSSSPRMASIENQGEDSPRQYLCFPVCRPRHIL